VRKGEKRDRGKVAERHKRQGVMEGEENRSRVEQGRI